MPQGLIRIVLPLLMVMAFLLYMLSVGLKTDSSTDSPPITPASTAE